MVLGIQGRKRVNRQTDSFNTMEAALLLITILSYPYKVKVPADRVGYVGQEEGEG